MMTLGVTMITILAPTCFDHHGYYYACGSLCQSLDFRSDQKVLDLDLFHYRPELLMTRLA